MLCLQASSSFRTKLRMKLKVGPGKEDKKDILIHVINIYVYEEVKMFHAFVFINDFEARVVCIP